MTSMGAVPRMERATQRICYNEGGHEEGPRQVAGWGWRRVMRTGSMNYQSKGYFNRRAEHIRIINEANEKCGIQSLQEQQVSARVIESIFLMTTRMARKDIAGETIAGGEERTCMVVNV